jgi:hypothetical protein
MSNPVGEVISKFMPSTSGMRLAGMGVGTVVIGTAAGLGTWWMQDAIDTQIKDKPWLLPLLAGFAGVGASLWMFGS